MVASSAPPPTSASALAVLISSRFNSTRGANPLPSEAYTLRRVGVRTSHSSPKLPDGLRSVDTAAVTSRDLRAGSSFSSSDLGRGSIRDIYVPRGVRLLICFLRRADSNRYEVRGQGRVIIRFPSCGLIVKLAAMKPRPYFHTRS